MNFYEKFKFLEKFNGKKFLRQFYAIKRVLFKIKCNNFLFFKTKTEAKVLKVVGLHVYLWSFNGFGNPLYV